jgi:chromosome segregation ATPase
VSRTELIVATAIILFLAFALGWSAYWLLHRFTRVAGADSTELEQLALALHEAEETRDEAIVYLQTREEELSNQIAQLEAELRAAMDGLRGVRAENERLRAHIDRTSAG